MVWCPRGKLIVFVSLAVAGSCAFGFAFQTSSSDHPTWVHVCTDGQMRTRLLFQQDREVGSPVANLQDNGWQVVFVSTQRNTSLTETTPVTISYSQTVTSPSGTPRVAGGGVSGIAASNLAEWLPLASEAVVKPSARVTVAAKPPTTETLTVGDSATTTLDPCSWWTTTIRRPLRLATLSQTFVDVVTCSNQSAGLPVLETTGRRRTTTVKSDGVSSSEAIFTSGVDPCP
jgi:hypothetical protein